MSQSVSTVAQRVLAGVLVAALAVFGVTALAGCSGGNDAASNNAPADAGKVRIGDNHVRFRTGAFGCHHRRSG